eukprot:scaffold3767_cov116-Skeletonema_menzelii.AAC.3
MLRAGADTTVGGVQRDSSFQLKPFKFRFKTELDPLTLPFQLHSGDVGADASCSSERVRGLPGIYLFLHIQASSKLEIYRKSGGPQSRIFVTYFGPCREDKELVPPPRERAIDCT